MNIVMFYHSLISDWNHGNAHFLRGIASEFISRGHRVDIYEPADAWSLRMLRKYHGSDCIEQFHRTFPKLSSISYDIDKLDLDIALDQADLVLVHEWNDPALINRIARHRRRTGHYKLLFHDTHHRSHSSPEEIEQLDLQSYDGVLAFGRAVQQIYLSRGYTDKAWIWHEAADVRVFKPLPGKRDIDLVWIGNFGDNERTAQLEQYLIKPAQQLGLLTEVYGVRYAERTLNLLKKANISYKGWTPNFLVPRIFARARATVHIPRQYYVRNLPGIPTIRPFEAMACGIALVCSPWQDCENLFTPGLDYLPAENPEQMTEHLQALMSDDQLAQSLGQNGRRTILAKHTCSHRVDQLMRICRQLGINEDKTAIQELPVTQSEENV